MTRQIPDQHVMIASLPWYDLPPARRGLNAFWQEIRGELLRQTRHTVAQVPAALDRETPLPAQWMRSDLILSQCCGPDLFTAAGSALEVVARPVFLEPGCAGGMYYSYIVSAHAALPPSPRLAINSPHSRSGCTALLNWLADAALNHTTQIVTGSHAASLDELRAGRADAAAIDVHSWSLLDTHGISTLARTPATPAPPYVRHRHSPVTQQELFAALEKAAATAGLEIGISGVLPAARHAYTQDNR